MHILNIPSWYPATADGIGGSFFREQALALAKHGHQIGVISPQLISLRALPRFFNKPYGSVEENDQGVPTYRSHGMAWFPRVPYANSKLFELRGLRLYKRYVKRHGKPDLIHAHSMLNGGVLARAIAMQHNTPYLITEHSSAFARRQVRPWQVGMARKVAAGAARRFAVSPPFCAMLEDILGVDAGPWKIMPNIVAATFSEAHVTAHVQANDKFVFINVALLTEKKGVHNLIAAFAQAFSDDRSVILNIGGDGVERPRLEALAKHFGVAERIRFLGALTRKQVVEAMAGSDAFVLSSLYETFGVVVVEALALGKPVIATSCGGPESIVREQDGLLVPPNDVAALASAMRALRADYSNYRAPEIRDACIARYGETAIATRLSQVYAEIIQERSAQAFKGFPCRDLD